MMVLLHKGLHTWWQQKGVPEEGEDRRTFSRFVFRMRIRRPPQLRDRATRFPLPDRCALTGRVSRG